MPAVSQIPEFIGMYYGSNNSSELIRPLPRMSYKTEPIYKNDVVAGIKYLITLNGQLILDEDNFKGNVAQAMEIFNKIFNKNHQVLYMESDQKGVLFMANNVLVRSITYGEGTHNWLKEVPYTVELESMDVVLGEGLANLDIQNSFLGYQKDTLPPNMNSPFMEDLKRYSIQDWDEQFSISTAENQTTRTTSVDRICAYDGDDPYMYNCEWPTPLHIRTTLGGEFFSIQYSVKATGKQIAHREGDNIMPGWEHAKRFCHTKLLQQMGGLFQQFLPLNGPQPRELENSPQGLGVFAAFTFNNAPTWKIYNEYFSVDASESDEAFGITYNAIVMRNCPTETTALLGGTAAADDTYTMFCSDGVIHTVTKTVQKVMEANEYTKMDTQNTTITINGQITGLVAGAGWLESKILFDATRNGRGLIVYNPFVGDGASGPDKYRKAEIAFDKIFDYYNYDLNVHYKELFGINAYTLRVSPTSRLLPSNMSVVRNMIGGTIEYSATYGTIINCDPNNFELSISTKQPTPVIAEFTIPNNNIRDVTGEICETGKGYNVIQLLGTTTPKTIDVSVNASVALNYNKCCLGTNENYNMLDYDFFRLQSFLLPSGMVIPYISDKYALTKKTKSVSYPGGSMSIGLSYMCADICEIDNYFDDVRFEAWDFNSLTYNQLVTDPTMFSEKYYLDLFESATIRE